MSGQAEELSMFTGIITGLGHIIEVKPLGADASHGKQLVLQAPAGYLDDVQLERKQRDGECNEHQNQRFDLGLPFHTRYIFRIGYGGDMVASFCSVQAR